ncbi:hypothetical protein [Bradyrhizobium sp. CCBAU 53338]|uniref:hypothetical protein n=1 Tax=Bradyrhizobium sp. CCBAU 53338 TaxID=1325111 RepID=UPI00188B3727|nr:hypothetical protein [Bradyrhizobium sp. CCBAU 53338]
MDEELSPFIQLQGLRLLRAFLCIENPAHRLSVIELAERFAGEEAISATSRSNGRTADVITFPNASPAS